MDQYILHAVNPNRKMNSEHDVYIFSLKGLKKDCKKGCTKNLCLNGGICIERWGEGHYECDCSHSNFAGKQCELGVCNG